MPKVIFTSRYVQDAPSAQLENCVRYIGTREGVGKIDKSKPLLPATINQKNLIRQLIRDIPAAKEMLEYTNSLLQPTIGNASELISCALEQHLDLVGKRENYVDYIADRPRVERVGKHGLSTDVGQSVVLAKVQDEVAKHKGTVRIHVVSPRREGATKLGYDSAKQWMALLRLKWATLRKHVRIDNKNLCWYTAFHSGSCYPHVHPMTYSAKDNDGYLTEESIKATHLELTHDIFRQDFAYLHDRRNQAHAELETDAADVMRKMTKELRSGTLINPEIRRQIIKLLERLQNIGGKKVYSYLKRDVKNLIDQVVDELAKGSRVGALYQTRGEWQNEILLTYQNMVPSLSFLSRQPQFKSIKNVVITEAVNFGRHQVTFEGETASFIESDDLLELRNGQEFSEGVILEWQGQEHTKNRSGESRGQEWWNGGYKEARKDLYEGKEQEPDFAEVFRLFVLEARSGDGLTMHDLGRMLTNGLGREIDPAGAQEWYARALAAFLKEEKRTEERQRPYLQYHIGKVFTADLGIERDYEKTAQWFFRVATTNHRYAQYSLAGLYYRRQGEEQSYE